MKTLQYITLAALLSITPAHAQDWRTLAQQCTEKLANEELCGAHCSWEKVARCVVHRAIPNALPELVGICIQTVAKQTSTKPLGFERVGPTVECVARTMAH